jgi:hypothetical protein
VNAQIRKPDDVPLKSTFKVAVEWLELDRKNPRLLGSYLQASNEQVIAQLYRAEELSELLQSIAANGYLDIEPLIVMINNEGGAFIVLEGNRRLAAVQLFRDPRLADKIAAAENLRISVPEISEDARPTLEEISVYRVGDREDARAFIGFKHINGPAKWDSYAKGRFAAEWYRTGKEQGVTLEAIAEQIGDRHDTIKRMVAGIYVLEQASAAEIFRIENRYSRKFNFSHLYTALSRSQYMSFLGLPTAWTRFDPTPNPIAERNLDRLRDVLVWIYGSKEDDTKQVIRSQNPDIKYLGEVLASREGLHELQMTRDLDRAHATTEPIDAKLSASLIRARAAIREVSNSLRGYDGRDASLLDIAADVRETAEIVHERMRKKRDAAIAEE